MGNDALWCEISSTEPPSLSAAGTVTRLILVGYLDFRSTGAGQLKTVAWVLTNFAKKDDFAWEAKAQ